MRLDELVAAALDGRAGTRPAHRFDGRARAVTVVRGAPQRLERAVANLLDNAAKWSPPGEPVEVDARATACWRCATTARASPSDLAARLRPLLPRAAARGLPGSGLGLAIVRQVAERHGGAVTRRQPPDGGGLLQLRLPTVAMQASDATPARHALPTS